MRLCMPTVDARGLESRLSPHFGSAPFFTLVDDVTGATEALSNEHARHEHGQCRPTAALAGHAVGAVVCRGLGRGAYLRLEQAGIRVLLTEEWFVAAALESYRSGRLEEPGQEQLCQGHGH